MTKREPTSGVSGQTERAATKAEFQRVEERRHIETVLRKERRIRWPKAPRLGNRRHDPKVVAKTPEHKEPRPLTPAEKERIAERRHVETVMRNARRSRIQLRKLVPARSGGNGAPGAVAAPAAPPARPSDNRKTVVVFVIAGALLACALLGLSLSAVLQQSRLAERLTTLREETAQWRSGQQQSLDKIDQTLQQLAATEDKVETKLQTVADGQAQIASKVGALEASRVADSAQWQERLTGVEKTTSEGLAGVTSRLDSEESLAASVRELLPTLRPDSAGSTQSPSETLAP
ncbi:MAG: hypothetical protein NTX23_06825 [Candidatus Bipolaricaulota bacterium]|nr:hypothetical protein [Candidatus Bipolaricaulota bacterium]